MDLEALERGIQERWISAMRCGDFEKAWRESDLALELKALFPDVQTGRPLHLRDVWDGTPIDGRALLVRCHHGLGDSIHFVRFCKLARKRVTKLILKTQPELIALFAGVDGIDEILSLHDPDPNFEVDAEIMELPFILRTTAKTFPGIFPYIRSEKKPLIPLSNKPKIGLCWRTGNFIPQRSIPLEGLKYLKFSDHSEIYSLQKNVTFDEAYILSFAAGPAIGLQSFDMFPNRYILFCSWRFAGNFKLVKLV